MLYAISQRQFESYSQVNSGRFASRVAAPLSEASKQQKELLISIMSKTFFWLMSQRLIPRLCLEESLQRAQSSGVAVRFATEALSVSKPGDKFLSISKAVTLQPITSLSTAPIRDSAPFNPCRGLSRILKIERAGDSTRVSSREAVKCWGYCHGRAVLLSDAFPYSASPLLLLM